MFGFAATLYHPTRALGTDGAVADTPGTGRTVFINAAIHQGKLVATLDADDPAAVGDLLDIAEGMRGTARYRVTGRQVVSGARVARLELERETRPVSPA